MNTANATLNLAPGSSTINIQPGMYVVSANIPQTAIVTSINPNVSIQLSQAPGIAGVGAVTFIPLGNTAQTFAYSATSPVKVELHSPGYAARIAHWGTSVIMDGQFDDDKSFIFTQGMTAALSVTNGQRWALQSFRISPSASNGVGGNALGAREIVNRMQMVMRQSDILSAGQFLIEIFLNAPVSLAAPTWQSVGGSSLAQYINHAASTFVGGGEPIYAFFTNSAGGSTNLTTTAVELNLIRDLGNGIIGGGTSAPNTGFYPDGPDIITITARNVGTAAASIFGRLSWTEAQA
jgi:hypothetical protein